MSSPVEAKTPSKRRRQQRILDEWCKKRRNEDKESDETASTETPVTNTEHDGRSQTDPEVGESMKDSFTEDLESSTEKNTGDISACSNVCCSCEGEAYQPKNDIILASMSNKGRRFLPPWNERFPWITICATRKKVFCTYCRQARSLKMISFSKKGDDAFTTKGFDNYKKAIEKFRVHETCETSPVG